MMGLAEPAWLALAPLAALFFVAVARVWRRSTGRSYFFSGTHVLEQLNTQASPVRWPVVLSAASVAVLIAGLSGPLLSVTVERATANVVIVMDTSGSMTATDVSPTRLSAAKSAAKEFVNSLPEQWKASLIGFNQVPYLVQAPTNSRGSVENAIDSLTAVGGTATGDAVDLAIDVGRGGSAERLNQALEEKDSLENPSKSVIVILSDGRQTAGNKGPQQAAERAARLGVPVFTIAFGTDEGRISVLDADGKLQELEVPPDPGAMSILAAASAGQSFTAVTEEELSAVYSSVAASLEPEQDYIKLGPILVLTALATGAAGVLGLVKHRYLP